MLLCSSIPDVEYTTESFMKAQRPERANDPQYFSLNVDKKKQC